MSQQLLWGVLPAAILPSSPLPSWAAENGKLSYQLSGYPRIMQLFRLQNLIGKTSSPAPTCKTIIFFFSRFHTHTKKNKKRKKKWNHRQSKSANSNVIAAIIRLLYRKSTWPLGCNHCSFLLTYLTFVLNTPLQILPGPWSLSPRWKVVPLL